MNPKYFPFNCHICHSSFEKSQDFDSHMEKEKEQERYRDYRERHCVTIIYNVWHHWSYVMFSPFYRQYLSCILVKFKVLQCIRWRCHPCTNLFWKMHEYYNTSNISKTKVWICIAKINWNKYVQSKFSRVQGSVLLLCDIFKNESKVVLIKL